MHVLCSADVGQRNELRQARLDLVVHKRIEHEDIRIAAHASECSEDSSGKMCISVCIAPIVALPLHDRASHAESSSSHLACCHLMTHVHGFT